MHLVSESMHACMHVCVRFMHACVCVVPSSKEPHHQGGLDEVVDVVDGLEHARTLVPAGTVGSRNIHRQAAAVQVWVSNRPRDSSLPRRSSEQLSA